jgi:hypothetical protein
MDEVESILCNKIGEIVSVEGACLRCDYWSNEFLYCSYPSEHKSPVTIKKGGRFGIKSLGPAVMLGEISGREWPDIPEQKTDYEESLLVPYTTQEIPQSETDLMMPSTEVSMSAFEDRLCSRLDIVEDSVQKDDSSLESMLDLMESATEENLSSYLWSTSSQIMSPWEEFEDPFFVQRPFFEQPMDDFLNQTW